MRAFGLRARNISPQFISVLSGIDSAHKLRLLIVAALFCVVRRGASYVRSAAAARARLLVDVFVVGGLAVKSVFKCTAKSLGPVWRRPAGDIVFICPNAENRMRLLVG